MTTKITLRYLCIPTDMANKILKWQSLIWDFRELECIPQGHQLKSGQWAASDQKHFFLTVFKNTSNVLPMLKSCEISSKTWISGVSIYFWSSIPTSELSSHKATSRQCWVEDAAPSRWGLCPSGCFCPQHPLWSNTWPAALTYFTSLENLEKLTYSEFEFGI